MAEPPDYDWLIRLYEELRTRLHRLIVPKRMREEMEERLDPVIFRQMLEHRVFSLEDLGRLIDYMFGICGRLQAPARDEAVREKELCIQQLFLEKATIHQVAPTFLLEIHEILDWIEEDLANLSS